MIKDKRSHSFHADVDKKYVNTNFYAVLEEFLFISKVNVFNFTRVQKYVFVQDAVQRCKINKVKLAKSLFYKEETLSKYFNNNCNKHYNIS